LPGGKRLAALVRAVADSTDARITLYGVQSSRGGADNVSWIQTDSQGNALDFSPTDPLASLAARTHRERSGFGNVRGTEVIQTAVPIDFHHQQRWVALYTRPLTGVDETVALIRRQLLLAALVTAVLAVIA